MAPRPIPLSNLVTGRPQNSDYQSLTPRTPHSQAGRAEEALDEIELEGEEDYRTYRQQQTQPLLVSSSSGSFPPSGYRSRGDEHQSQLAKLSRKVLLKRLPLALGGFAACLLLFLIFLSVKRPQVLESYIGEKSASASAQSELKDFAAATTAVPSPTPTHGHTHPLNPDIISYENYTKFPLLPAEYRAECRKLNRGFMSHGTYWSKSHGPQDVVHHDPEKHMMFEGERTQVCTKTITYMLDGHVGLLADLALMAQAAALARECNRTFLVDDTYWDRGKWVDHFQDVRARQPGPEPGCRAPSPEELVACPRTARHWVINSRTALFHFGHPFADEFENPFKISLNRLRPIFDWALGSLRETIRPNAQNAALIRLARTEYSERFTSPYIGVHLRRGDRKAVSWDYHGKYVPIPKYAEAIRATYSRVFQNNSNVWRSVVYIASDSPSAQRELIGQISSNTSVFSLADSHNPQLQTLVSPKDYVQKEFDVLEESERIKLTRGMVVDFAMLSGMWAWDKDIVPDATICTISSNICRLSAVGLGWERAFGEIDDGGNIDEKGKRWVEIDNRDMVIPLWEAFELFN